MSNEVFKNAGIPVTEEETPKVETPEVPKEEIKEEPKVETPPVVEETTPESSLTEDQVFEYINKTYGEQLGKEIKSIDDFKIEKVVEVEKTPELPEEVQKIIDFQKETKRPAKDFFLATKDWSEEPEDDRVREYLKDKYPTLNKDELTFQIKAMKKGMESLEDDEDNPEAASDRKMEASIKWKTTLAESDSYLKTRNEKYHVPIVQDNSAAQKQEEFSNEFNTVLGSFEEVKLDSLAYKPKQKIENISSMEDYLGIFESKEQMVEAAYYARNKAQMLKDLRDQWEVDFNSDKLKRQNNIPEPEKEVQSPPKLGDSGYAKFRENLR